MLAADKRVQVLLLIRDERGSFTTAGCKLQDVVVDPFISELLACREGKKLNSEVSRWLRCKWTAKKVKSFGKMRERLKLVGIHVLRELKLPGDSFEALNISFAKRTHLHNTSPNLTQTLGSTKTHL
jgi:hypothetical protein